MALTGGQIKELNSFFSEGQIKKTAARLVRKLSANAPLGQITEALGIVPKEQVKEFRKNCKLVPVTISTALTRAIRAHLGAVNRKGGFAGPQELRINIKAGRNFALDITQLDTHTEITLTMQTGEAAH
jgi:hypothetical protein